MATGTSRSNVPSWLSSDNIAKLAFTLPFLPLLFIIAWKAGFFDKKTTSQAYDPKTGIGRGAPGFQTNVRRVAIPRSELHKYNLSPEDEARVLQQNGGMLGTARANSSTNSKKTADVSNEWIPEGHHQSKKSGASGSSSSTGNGSSKARKRK